MWMTWGYREQRRSSYNQGFRTFGFEWNENYLWTCEPFIDLWYHLG